MSRDPDLPELDGLYLYGDDCGSTIEWLRPTEDGVEHGAIDLDMEGIFSWGSGPGGEVYVARGSGRYRLVPG